MQHLSEVELKAILANARSEEEKTMFLVGYWHGLRASEIISLTVRNVSDRFITVRRLKGSLKTVQPWVRHTDPELSEYERLEKVVEGKKASERLFPDWSRFNLNYAFKVAAQKAGLPNAKCHPHVLKHSIALKLLKETKINVVQAWLGHRSLSSTGMYLKLSDQEAAAEVLAAVAGGH